MDVTVFFILYDFFYCLCYSKISQDCKIVETMYNNIYKLNYSIDKSLCGLELYKEKHGFIVTMENVLLHMNMSHQLT